MEPGRPGNVAFAHAAGAQQHHRRVRRARPRDPGPAPGRRNPSRARRPHGRRPRGLRHADRRRRRLRQGRVVGVGFDIACGNAAIRTDRTVADLGATGTEVADARTWPTRSRETISFGVGRKNRADDAPTDDPLFEDPGLGRAVPPASTSTTRCRRRRGSSSARSAAATTTWTCSPTRPGALWVGVHFGSRGFGHTVASGFLALGQGGQWGERVPETEVLLDSDSRWETTTGR